MIDGLVDVDTVVSSLMMAGESVRDTEVSSVVIDGLADGEMLVVDSC